jgi:hypothetical protein
VTNCKDTYAFLSSVRDRNVPAAAPTVDLPSLQKFGLIQFLSAGDYAQATQALRALSADEVALAQAQAARAQAQSTLAGDERRTHSILFHLEGEAKRTALLGETAQAEQAYRAADADATARSKVVADLIAKKSLLDTLVPGAGGYVALTPFGAMETRRLGLALYRFSDVDFSSYWAVRQQVTRDLNDIADRASQAFAALAPPLSGVERSSVWTIAIGLAKGGSDLPAGEQAFLQAYGQIGRLSGNPENRLMAAEILATRPQAVDQALPLLTQLEGQVRKLGVPHDASLGVAAILLLGRRADGTFAAENLRHFLTITNSYESAALLGIMNVPTDQLAAKFAAYSATFRGWGFQPSEDVALASAYLALSEVPVDGMTPKLAILSKGLAAYLQYPLVAAAIVASIPVLEANEALGLLEEAYEIIGRRAMPAAPSELLCLAVRMIHGVRSATVTGLDTTATAAPAPMPYYGGPGFIFVPIVVFRAGYYSTFGGIAGVHPGHAHVGGGFVG